MERDEEKGCHRKIECPLCGAELTEEDLEKDLICPYCGALILEPCYDIEDDLGE